MSYAAMAAKNAPPEDEQVQPSQAFLDGGHFAGETEATNVVDDGDKINVVTPEWKEHPATLTSEHENERVPSPASIPHHAPGASEPHVSEVAPKPTSGPTPGQSRVLPDGSVKVGPNEEEMRKAAKKAETKAKEVGKETKDKAGELEDKAKEVGEDVKEKAEEVGGKAKKESKKLGKEAKEYAAKAEDEAKKLGRKAKAELGHAETAVSKYYAKTKEVILRPGVMGGILGVANVGLLSALSYVAYTRREMAWDRRIVAASVACTLALFGAEGVLAEKYIDTPEGREEAERAKREGSKVWLQTKETVLRPGVAGGLVGAVNVAVLGTVGYFSYKNWHVPKWDRNVVSSVAVGLIALSAAEGYLGKEYKDKELPRQKRKGNL